MHMVRDAWISLRGIPGTMWSTGGASISSGALASETNLGVYQTQCIARNGDFQKVYRFCVSHCEIGTLRKSPNSMHAMGKVMFKVKHKFCISHFCDVYRVKIYPQSCFTLFWTSHCEVSCTTKHWISAFRKGCRTSYVLGKTVCLFRGIHRVSVQESIRFSAFNHVRYRLATFEGFKAYTSHNYESQNFHFLFENQHTCIQLGFRSCESDVRSSIDCFAKRVLFAHKLITVLRVDAHGDGSCWKKICYAFSLRVVFSIVYHPSNDLTCSHPYSWWSCVSLGVCVTVSLVFCVSASLCLAFNVSFVCAPHYLAVYVSLTICVHVVFLRTCVCACVFAFMWKRVQRWFDECTHVCIRIRVCSNVRVSIWFHMYLRARARVCVCACVWTHASSNSHESTMLRVIDVAKSTHDTMCIPQPKHTVSTVLCPSRSHTDTPSLDTGGSCPQCKCTKDFIGAARQASFPVVFGESTPRNRGTLDSAAYAIAHGTTGLCVGVSGMLVRCVHMRGVFHFIVEVTVFHVTLH